MPHESDASRSLQNDRSVIFPTIFLRILSESQDSHMIDESTINNLNNLSIRINAVNNTISL